MNPLENYKAPTPVKWRKIGDTIMLIGAGASTGVMGLPLSEHHKLWIIYGMGLLVLAGKAITNFFKEEENKNP